MSEIESESDDDASVSVFADDASVVSDDVLHSHSTSSPHAPLSPDTPRPPTQDAARTLPVWLTTNNNPTNKHQKLYLKLTEYESSSVLCKSLLGFIDDAKKSTEYLKYHMTNMKRFNFENEEYIKAYQALMSLFFTVLELNNSIKLIDFNLSFETAADNKITERNKRLNYLFNQFKDTNSKFDDLIKTDKPTVPIVILRDGNAATSSPDASPLRIKLTTDFINTYFDNIPFQLIRNNPVQFALILVGSFILILSDYGSIYNGHNPDLIGIKIAKLKYLITLFEQTVSFSVGKKDKSSFAPYLSSFLGNKTGSNIKTPTYQQDGVSSEKYTKTYPDGIDSNGKLIEYKQTILNGYRGLYGFIIQNPKTAAAAVAAAAFSAPIAAPSALAAAVSGAASAAAAAAAGASATAATAVAGASAVTASAVDALKNDAGNALQSSVGNVVQSTVHSFDTFNSAMDTIKSISDPVNTYMQVNVVFKISDKDQIRDKMITILQNICTGLNNYLIKINGGYTSATLNKLTHGSLFFPGMFYTRNFNSKNLFNFGISNMSKGNTPWKGGRTRKYRSRRHRSTNKKSYIKHHKKHTRRIQPKLKKQRKISGRKYHH